MSLIIDTPKQPYYTVIFISEKIDEDKGYDAMFNRMVELVSKQDCFLGFGASREELGITVSYRRDEELMMKEIMNFN